MTNTVRIFVSIKRRSLGREPTARRAGDPSRTGIWRRRVDLTCQTTRYIKSGDSGFRGSVNFHAITGIQYHRFGAAGIPQKAIDLGVSPEPFEHLDVRGVMAKARAK